MAHATGGAQCGQRCRGSGNEDAQDDFPNAAVLTIAHNIKTYFFNLEVRSWKYDVSGFARGRSTKAEGRSTLNIVRQTSNVILAEGDTSNFVIRTS